LPLKGCIRDFKTFVSLNTFFLSPTTLYKYLFGKTSSFSSSATTVVDASFLTKIRACNSPKELEGLLNDNPTWLDILIKLTISYETLGRLFSLLNYELERIANNELKEAIIPCLKSRKKQLPETSKDIKDKFENCKGLISLLMSKAFFGELSEFLKQAIDDSSSLWRYLLEEIFLRFEQPIEGFKILLKAAEGKEEVILQYLNELYKKASRGEQKVLEGYDYEAVLLEYLLNCGIEAERISSEEEIPKDLCRNWDIYIPNKSQPKFVIECMYNVTTSSGQTNKCKAILECLPKLKKKSIGVLVLMDGAGWIARGSDAKKLLKEKDLCVFTFNKDSLEGALNFIGSFLKSQP